MWPYYALPSESSYHDTFQAGKRGHSTESSPGPAVSASQVTCIFIQSLALWFITIIVAVVFFIASIYFDSSGYCVKETSVCLWGIICRYFLWNSSPAHPD